MHHRGNKQREPAAKTLISSAERKTLDFYETVEILR